LIALIEKNPFNIPRVLDRLLSSDMTAVGVPAAGDLKDIEAAIDLYGTYLL
jgi:hypothetical protein